MPQEYLDCVASAIAGGKSRAEAQKVCSIAYFRKHGKTPQQAAGDESKELSTEDRRVIKLSAEIEAEVAAAIGAAKITLSSLPALDGILGNITRETAMDLAGRGEFTSPVQLAREGTWKHPKYGEFTLSRENFLGFIQNFDGRTRGVEIAYDVEHKPEDGAAGWFVPGSMRIEMSDEGQAELWVDVAWTPRGLQLALDREYKYSSLTFQYNWTDPETGEEHKNVILGAAFCVDPWIKRMQSVQESLRVELSDGLGMEVNMASHGSHKKRMTADGVELEGMKCPECDGKGKVKGKKCLACGGSGKKEDEAIAAADDGGDDAVDLMDDADEEDVEALAEQYRSIGGKLAKALKNKRGAPTARAHIKATHELMGPVVSAIAGHKKAKEEPKEMAGTKDDAAIQTGGSGAQEYADQVKALSAQLAELKEREKEQVAINARRDAELAILRRKSVRDDMMRLTESWGPRKGEQGFRIRASEREKIADYMVALAEADGRENERVMRLTGKDALEDGNRSKLLDGFKAIMEALPEHRLHLTAQGRPATDDEGELNLAEDEKLHRATLKLAEEKNIPYHEAAMKVATTWTGAY